jgi:putative ABC transport system permease protein
MIGFLLQIRAMMLVALRRLLAQRGLALATAAGLTVSVSLVMSIPLYADATHFRILREGITGGQGGPAYAPLSFLFRYAGQTRGGPQWADVYPIDQYLSQSAGREIGLPETGMVRLFRTDALQLFPPFVPSIPETQYLLTWVNPAFLSDAEQHVRLIDGSFPARGGTASGSPVEVMVGESVALEFGIQVGDTYFARRDPDIEIPMRVVGIWAAIDPRAAFWDVRANQLALMSEPDYAGRVSPAVEDELLSSAWYLVVDGSGLHADDVAVLLDNVQAVRQRVETLLPRTELAESQLAELEAYQRDAPALTLLLYAFSIPILGLILAFVGLVAGLFVHQRRTEIAILRSRGGSMFQVAGIAALEGVLIGALALAIGTPIGQALAHAIGRARSFLNFTAPGELRVSVLPQDIATGALAIGAVLLVQIVVPTLSAARHTIVTYKQERARAVQRAWWQRAWFDVLLLIPTGYGAYLLNLQGSLAATQEAALPDPLRNPLLLLVPALGIFAATLFVLRLIPALMAGVAWLAARTDSVGLLMAARYLARTPAFYNAPLALLVLTLSLSAFTASLAQTLDLHLTRQTYYQVGTDLRLTELGTTVNENTANPVWTFRPIEDHLSIDGVRAATRVGRYSAAVLRAGGGQAQGVFLALDPLTFAQVAYWQRNFAADSLAVLLNSLHGVPEGVVVSRDFMVQEGLRAGDTLTLGVNAGPSSVGMTAPIIGVVDLFPTWYPEDGPLLVGNLDYLFGLMGTEYVHEAWLKTRPNADVPFVVASVRGFSALLDPATRRSDVVTNGLNTLVSDWVSTAVQVTAEQRRPERQGLFGLLSVGFGASALLTVIGFLLYALFSFRRRFIEMGMLRAIGLSARQMQALLASELIFLISIGVGVGSVLGIAVSRWFIPYLQLGTATTARYPPFVVEIAWPAIIQIYILFGVLFVAALAGLVALLMRMKIFQAVKLGETA